MGKEPRVAIVSDPLVQRGGAERVVEAMAEAFPNAPIYALLYSSQSGPRSLAKRVRSSFIGKIPGATRRHRLFLPLYPSAIESFDLSDYDVIISSHHTVAKGLLRGAEQLHICYCHTPMRALWERSAAELKTLPAIARPLAAPLFHQLRVWDYVTAARVDTFVANSRITATRIARHYGRSSIVLNPPIDVAKFRPEERAATAGNGYFLIASRAVPYKRVDIAVAAARAAGKRVVVVGGDHPGLAGMPGVETLGIVDDARLRELMAGATALLFPQYEDFGMTPLEVNACGRPVIAFGAGGALETVVDGRTGILVPEQSVEAFAQALHRFDTLHFDPVALRAHAESFSRAAFIERLREIVAREWSMLR
jgi:glycosyltransferase involved in cell wall biosynthesis